jgi:hypothetical protein
VSLGFEHIQVKQLADFFAADFGGPLPSLSYDLSPIPGVGTHFHKRGNCEILATFRWLNLPGVFVRPPSRYTIRKEETTFRKRGVLRVAAIPRLRSLRFLRAGGMIAGEGRTYVGPRGPTQKAKEHRLKPVLLVWRNVLLDANGAGG